jgi:hypothetical protein
VAHWDVKRNRKILLCAVNPSIEMTERITISPFSSMGLVGVMGPAIIYRRGVGVETWRADL